MKTTQLALLILLFIPNLVKAQLYQQPAIPTQFASAIEEYIFFDNNFNVIQRLRTEEKVKNNLMTLEDRVPERVSIFEVDYSKIKNEVALSKFIESADAAKTLIDGKLLIPCLDKDWASYQTLRLKFGEPKHRTFGRKVLSRATYYIEPVGPTGGFFAKFIPHIPGLEQKLEREILVNDYIKSQLSELPVEMRNLSMDSFMAVNLNVLGIPVSVAYRSADRILVGKSASVKTYPGHGLLGCDSCMNEYASKFAPGIELDKAIDRWKTRELLPKLAKYMAYSHQVLGVSFEAHTQNMVFDIDTNTGRIANIYFRDFADVLLNPVPLLAERKMPTDIDWQRVKLMSVHGNYFSDQGVSVAKNIWYHASIYSGQGVTSHITGFQKQQRHLRLFLESYIAETQNIIGQKIELSEDAQKVMSQLENKVSKEEFYSGQLQERSPLRNAMATILKSVIEQASSVQLKKIEENLIHAVLAKDQKKASKEFYKLISLQRVVFMDQASKENIQGADTKNTWLKNTLNSYLKLGLFSAKKQDSLIFKISDGRLWALDSSSGKPVAVTIESFSEKKNISEKIKSFFKLNTSMAVRCESLFSR